MYHERSKKEMSCVVNGVMIRSMQSCFFVSNQQGAVIMNWSVPGLVLQTSMKMLARRGGICQEIIELNPVRPRTNRTPRYDD